jgi:FeS assembly SUF system protein
MESGIPHMAVNKEEVLKALRNCYDPEIPINIVDLGLVYGIDVKGDKVHISMTLTARGCPMYSFISENVKEEVKKVKGVKAVDVEMIWDPPWSPERMSKEAHAQLGF